MSVESTVERYAAAKPGYDLVSYAEVALPFYRLRVRTQVMSTKGIPALDEFVLRGVSAEVVDPNDLGALLGLDQDVLDGVVVSLLGDECLKPRFGNRLELTEKGRTVAATAKSVRSEERVVTFDYDGLLRIPRLLDSWLEPRDLEPAGLREIPPHPAKRPDVVELRGRLPALEALIRTVLTGQDTHCDLLAVKGIDRRERTYQAAVAAVYRAQRGSDVQVSFLVDGEPSPGHDQAFAEAGLAKRLGIVAGLRRSKPLRLDPAVKDQADEQEEARLRDRIKAVQANAPELDRLPGDAQHRVESELREARAALQALPIRSVETYEHPRYLDLALRGSRRRLLIVSPWIRSAVVDRAFLEHLEARLKAGLDVRIGYGINTDPEADIDAESTEKLGRLAHRYSNFRFQHLGRTHAKILISDRAFIVVTSFNWLSFRGDPNRTFRDERGNVITIPDYVDQEWDAWSQRWPSAPTTVSRTQ